MTDRATRNGLRLDVDTGVLRHDRVLVQRSPVATLVMGFGTKAVQLRNFACGGEDDFDPFIARCCEIDAAIESGRLAKTRRYRLPRSAYLLEDRLFRRLVIAEALAKAGFDPDEPRDELGRWTTAGGDTSHLQEGRSFAPPPAAGSAPTEEGDSLPLQVGRSFAPPLPLAAGPAADDFAAVLGRWAGWAFGNPAEREALAALGRFAARAVAGSVGAVGGAITALGVLIIPTNKDTTSRGTLPDRPDISYTFDAPAGILTLSRDGEVFYAGRMQGGAFRDDRGRIFGHLLGGNVVVDPEILPAVASQAHSEAEPETRGRPIAEVESDSDKPRLCPDPTPDFGWQKRSERALQYQEQITSLPRGVDVELRRVRFDGCRESDGTMLEAKGEGFEWAMIGPMEFFKNYKGVEAVMDQAERQSEAAPDRRIEWYFAEEPVADYFRDKFAEAKFSNITVIYEPYARRSRKWASCIPKYMSIGANVLKARRLVPFGWPGCSQTGGLFTRLSHNGFTKDIIRRSGIGRYARRRRKSRSWRRFTTSTVITRMSAIS